MPHDVYTPACCVHSKNSRYICSYQLSSSKSIVMYSVHGAHHIYLLSSFAHWGACAKRCLYGSFSEMFIQRAHIVRSVGREHVSLCCHRRLLKVLPFLLILRCAPFICVSYRFREYSLLMETKLMPRFNATWHWAKLETLLRAEGEVETVVRPRLATRFGGALASLSRYRTVLDPNGTLSNKWVDTVLGPVPKQQQQ